MLQEQIQTINQKILPISTEPFSREELVRLISKVKHAKAVRLDSIPVEEWKTGALRDQLLEVCNRALTGTVPEV